MQIPHPVCIHAQLGILFGVSAHHSPQDEPDIYCDVSFSQSMGHSLLFFKANCTPYMGDSLPLLRPLAPLTEPKTTRPEVPRGAEAHKDATSLKVV